MKIQKLSNSKHYKSWAGKGCNTHSQNSQRLAESLTRDLAGNTQFRTFENICEIEIFL